MNVSGPGLQNYDGAHICGADIPEFATAGISKWGKSHLLIRVAGQLQQFDDSDFRHAVLTGARLWSDVCGVTFDLTTDANVYDIVVTTGPIDGAGKTLAWSQLPSGSGQSLQQKYDAGEPWIVALNPPGNRIDLTRVVAHEIGHAIGIPHIGGGNLMAPMYSTSIRGPRGGDIVEAVQRYGLPKPTTPTPTPDTPSGELFLTVGGERWKIPAERIT